MIKVLVVEDEDDIRQLLVEELEDKGYEVREAGDGAAAIQRVNEQKPDIIFADVMMSVMDGFELIARLRENSETSEIAVVLVTAMSSHETEKKVRELDVKHHLTKPWEPWALDFVLDEALKAGVSPSADGTKFQVYPPKLPVRNNSTDHLRG